MRKLLPSASRLAQLFQYVEDSGNLHWRERPVSDFIDEESCSKWNSRYAGILAGHIHSSGYLFISIDNSNYAAHRLIWKIVTGEEPPTHLDHMNNNRSDNRFENLRKATPSQNRMNSSVRSDSKSKFTGIYWHNRDKKWIAEITVDGQRKSLGRFCDHESAQEARMSAEQLYFGERRYGGQNVA